MRKLYMLAGLLVVLAGIVYGQNQKHAAITADQLQSYYSGDRDAYFEGNLPQAEIKFVHNLSWNGQEDMGLMEGPPYVIYLSDKYEDNLSITLMSLRHEECHVALTDKGIVEMENYGHGPKFEQCMVRLAEAGAFKGLW